MIFKNKKGMIWQQIVLAIIAVIVVVVVVMFFRSGSEKGFDFASDKIDALGDCDSDGFANLYDKCDCDVNVGDEWTEIVNKSEDCANQDKVCECKDGTCGCIAKTS